MSKSKSEEKREIISANRKKNKVVRHRVLEGSHIFYETVVSTVTETDQRNDTETDK